MILVCASCKASYLVSASVFTAGPRQVRCARCSYTWRADLPSRMTVVPVEPFVSSEPVSPKVPVTSIADDSVAPPTEAVSGVSVAFQPEQKPQESQKALQHKKISAQPRFAVRNLPVVKKRFSWRRIFVAIKVLSVLLITVAFAWLLVTSPLVDKIRREASHFFDAVGLTKPPLGEGFNLKQIQSERKFENGGMKLVVGGEIHNNSDETRAVPDINVNALGPDKKIIQSWRIEAPAATLAPGAMVPFRSSVMAPTGAVMEVNLSFVEPRHDNHP